MRGFSTTDVPVFHWSIRLREGKIRARSSLKTFHSHAKYQNNSFPILHNKGLLIQLSKCIRTLPTRLQRALQSPYRVPKHILPQRLIPFLHPLFEVSKTRARNEDTCIAFTCYGKWKGEFRSDNFFQNLSTYTPSEMKARRDISQTITHPKIEITRKKKNEG